MGRGNNKRGLHRGQHQLAISTSSRNRNDRFGHFQHRASENAAVVDDESTFPAFRQLSSFKMLIPLVIIVALGIGYKGYLETRINTPFNKVKVIQKSGTSVPDRFWGTYRPNVYFGMKTRDPNSLVMGIMWYYPKTARVTDDIRHWCEQADYLKGGYSWRKHDGKNFGLQVINDDGFSITTSFVKKLRGSFGGDWTARIAFDYGLQKNLATLGVVSFIFYVAIEDLKTGYLNANFTHGEFPTFGKGGGGVVNGNTLSFGNFRIKLSNVTNWPLSQSHLITNITRLSQLKEVVLENLRYNDESLLDGKIMKISLSGRKGGLKTPWLEEKEAMNFVAIQLTFQVPFAADIIFQSVSSSPTSSNHQPPPSKVLTGGIYETEVEKHAKLFDENFERVFEMKVKGFTENEVDFAKSAFSNLIGGIGYFYGASRVMSEHTQSPVPYWKAPLYTAVPSRSFFPRGFLWDEGFHGFLIGAWDLDIELDIMGHWFDLMNVQGWIPREQILGSEALARVPPEFVTQINSNANPPAFFLTLQFLLDNYEEGLNAQGSRLELLQRLYPRLVTWFDWFNSTQYGSVTGAYRWRGRDGKNGAELNAKTLTSGLDDYPRASHPSEDERHLDLRCWMAFAARALVNLAGLLEKPAEGRFVEAALYLRDNALLDHLHWSEQGQIYTDYGLHTDDAYLMRKGGIQPDDAAKGIKASHLSGPNYDGQSVVARVVRSNPKHTLLHSTFGYNSLFPFILRLLDANSPKLGVILNKLRDRDLLWTDYGLRSLSKSSPLYGKYNTEHDPPYWRGAIWINMNYLTLGALWHYGEKHSNGPYSALAKEIYTKLRTNLIGNLLRQYESTGFLWENYDDENGRGRGSRPFTGWTSLVVLMMAEKY